MHKYKLIKTKNKLIAMGLLGAMISLGGCSNKDNNQVPKRVSISSDYNKFGLFSPKVLV